MYYFNKSLRRVRLFGTLLMKKNATHSELRFDPLYWNQNGIVILLSSQCQTIIIAMIHRKLLWTVYEYRTFPTLQWCNVIRRNIGNFKMTLDRKQMATQQIESS